MPIADSESAYADAALETDRGDRAKSVIERGEIKSARRQSSPSESNAEFGYEAVHFAC
jgi:hypothetical protein